MSKYNTRYREHMNSILKNNPKSVKPKTTQVHKKIKILKKKPIINEEFEENTQMESDSATNKSSTIPQEKESKLIVEADEEIYAPQNQILKTREEEKLESIFESASFFNENILKNRVVLNKESLKMKLESNCLRENKLNVFFNVPFFPKAEMFPIDQLNSKSAKKFALITRNSENINGNIKSFLDSSIVNNEVHIINLGPKKRPQRSPNYAIFGLYKENNNLNNNIKDNNGQTRHRTIFSSIFPNKNKVNEEETIDITNIKEEYNKKVIEIKEDDEESSSSYNPIKKKEPKLKANGEKEEIINDTSKLRIMAERYKKNKEKLKKNIGEKKFKILENILIKKNYIKKHH